VRPTNVPSVRANCGGDIRCEFVLRGFLTAGIAASAGAKPARDRTGESGSSVRSMTGAGSGGCCGC
jgi:hypothetical protein